MTKARIALLTGVLAMVGAVQAAQAAPLVASDLLVHCENGRDYSLRPRGVSVLGEVVTGYLYLHPRRALHVRLIPMSNGYRYAGRNLWLDGIRETATLNLGKYHKVACTVSPGVQRVVVRVRG